MRTMKQFIAGLILTMIMAVPAFGADSMTPVTGDRSQIFMWMILLVTAVIAVIIIAILRKRDK